MEYIKGKDDSWRKRPDLIGSFLQVWFNIEGILSKHVLGVPNLKIIDNNATCMK